MATANFNQVTLDKFDLPLVVGGLGEDYDKIAKNYKEEFGEEYSEELYWQEISEFAEHLEEELNEFNEKLKHFKLTVEGGYYHGFQYNIEETSSYDDYESIQSIDDETADYYYGMTAKEIRAEFEQDLDEIREFLKESAKYPGLTEIYCVGVFSNGEAVYSKVQGKE